MTNQNPSYEKLFEKVQMLEAQNKQLRQELTATSQSPNYLGAFLKSAIDNLPFVAWLKDKDGKILHVNYLFSRKVYKPVNEIIGQTGFSILPGEQGKMYEALEQAVVQNGKKEELEEKLENKFFRVVIAPVFNSNNELVGTLGYERDITLERHALISLMEERDRLEILMDNIPYTIYFKDKESRFTKINKAQAELIGLKSTDEAIGKTDFDYFPEEHARLMFDDDQKIIQSGEPIIEKVEKLTNSENETRWVSATKYPIKDKAGKIIGIVGMSRDVTKERIAEQILKEAKNKAEESDRLKTAFLANMSHEIRTPMNGIIGFTNLLKLPGLSDEEKEEFLDHINGCGETLLNLIDDIIDISKIEAGQLKIKFEETDINKIIKDLHQHFSKIKVREEKEQVDIRINLDKDVKPFMLVTDPHRVKQILTNLIGNAMKFTHAGYIEFGYTLEKNDTVQFHVKDTGIGIPADKLNLIFERFGQVIDTTRINPKGTGLGLAISINLVRLLGGTMHVESEIDKGSTFYFSIPLKVPGKLENENDNTWATKTILVAEDEEENWIIIRDVLEKTKARLIWAKNGNQAVEACKANPNINLVLMDLKMPDMDGYEATKEIRNFREHIPVIAQTAYNWPFQDDESIKSGCDDFISKPIDKKELIRTIDRYINKSPI